MTLRTAIAICLTMSFAAGCASTRPIQIVAPECLWAERMEWTSKQVDAIVDCCPGLAMQLLTHNENFKRECRDD